MAEQGSFIWYELTTTDVQGATALYKDVIGWGTDRFEGADPPYWVWTAGGAGIGGVMATTDEAMKVNRSPYWVAYVYADDVDALTA